jgi:hypothetical protein
LSLPYTAISRRFVIHRRCRPTLYSRARVVPIPVGACWCGDRWRWLLRHTGGVDSITQRHGLWMGSVVYAAGRSTHSHRGGWCRWGNRHRLLGPSWPRGLICSRGDCGISQADSSHQRKCHVPHGYRILRKVEDTFLFVAAICSHVPVSSSLEVATADPCDGLCTASLTG